MENIKLQSIDGIYVVEADLVSQFDFDLRFVSNLIQNLITLKSTPYISKGDVRVNVKSIKGLLSANIKCGDSIKVQTSSLNGYAQANSDLDYLLKLINRKG